MRESAIERDYCARVRREGGMAIKLVAHIGLPDRLIVLPGGVIYMVEFKAPGQKPRKIQQYVIDKLQSLGATVLVIDSPAVPLPNQSD
jgi:hypothetical protein